VYQFVAFPEVVRTQNQIPFREKIEALSAQSVSSGLFNGSAFGTFKLYEYDKKESKSRKSNDTPATSLPSVVAKVPTSVGVNTTGLLVPGVKISSASKSNAALASVPLFRSETSGTNTSRIEEIVTQAKSSTNASSIGLLSDGNANLAVSNFSSATAIPRSVGLPSVVASATTLNRTSAFMVPENLFSVSSNICLLSGGERIVPSSSHQLIPYMMATEDGRRFLSGAQQPFDAVSPRFYADQFLNFGSLHNHLQSSGIIMTMSPSFDPAFFSTSAFNFAQPFPVVGSHDMIAKDDISPPTDDFIVTAGVTSTTNHPWLTVPPITVTLHGEDDTSSMEETQDQRQKKDLLTVCNRLSKHNAKRPPMSPLVSSDEKRKFSSYERLLAPAKTKPNPLSLDSSGGGGLPVSVTVGSSPNAVVTGGSKLFGSMHGAMASLSTPGYFLSPSPMMGAQRTPIVPLHFWSSLSPLARLSPRPGGTPSLFQFPGFFGNHMAYSPLLPALNLFDCQTVNTPSKNTIPAS